MATKISSMTALLMFWESEEEIVVIVEGFTCHIHCNAKDFEHQFRDYGYGLKNNEGERILEFCAAVNTVVENTIFKLKKRASHLVTYVPGPSKTQVDFVW